MITNPNETSPDRRAAWETVRTWLLRGIGAGAVIGTIASFYESFSGLVDWFRRIGFRGDRAVVAPLMADLVATFGEVVLVVAILEGWKSRTIRPLAWAAIIWGLALSVVGNAGRDGLRLSPAGIFDMAWNAVPPLSLAILMTVALAVVKLWFKAEPDEGLPPLPEVAGLALFHFRDALADGSVPSVAAIKKTARVAQPKAIEIREYLYLLRAEFERLGDETEAAPEDGAGRGGLPRPTSGLPRPTSALPPPHLVTDGSRPEVAGRKREG